MQKVCERHFLKTQVFKKNINTIELLERNQKTPSAFII